MEKLGQLINNPNQPASRFQPLTVSSNRLWIWDTSQCFGHCELNYSMVQISPTICAQQKLLGSTRDFRVAEYSSEAEKFFFK